jgi:hypothetical protein
MSLYAANFSGLYHELGDVGEQSALAEVDLFSDRVDGAADVWEKLSAQFITEHYCGESSQRSRGSAEHRVAHEPWRVAVAARAGFKRDPRQFTGRLLQRFFEGSLRRCFLRRDLRWRFLLERKSNEKKENDLTPRRRRGGTEDAESSE